MFTITETVTSKILFLTVCYKITTAGKVEITFVIITIK